MRSLHDTETYTEISERLLKLNQSSKALWGEMNVSQMLHHCQMPFRIALELESVQKPNVILRIIFRLMKSSGYNDKPWKRNLPTLESFKVTDDKLFDVELENLQTLVKQFYESRDKEKWAPHPFFGTLTPAQWGKMQYKHLDHHLQHFGA